MVHGGKDRKEEIMTGITFFLATFWRVANFVQLNALVDINWLQ